MSEEVLRLRRDQGDGEPVVALSTNGLIVVALTRGSATIISCKPPMD